MKPWLIALGAGRWQRTGIVAARAAGLQVLAVDGDAQAPALAHADRALVIDLRNTQAVIAAIDQLSQQAGLRPAGAVAFNNEAGMATAAALRAHFGLPGALPEQVQTMTRKDRQRALWSAAGVPCPVWRVAANRDECAQALALIGGTCIVKPVDAAGSRGVHVLRPGAPWHAAFDDALAISRAGHVIVEAFITGIEHTIETFSHAGRCHVLAITQKKKVPGTDASELHTAELPADALQAIADTCVRALAALGWTDGPGHTEMLRTASGELFMVESAGRGGGFMVADGLVPAISGFDLATACALQAIGAQPPLPGAREANAALLRFVPSRQGRIVRIRGFEARDAVRGVHAEALVDIDQNVGHAACDGDRLALILATGRTLREASARADLKEGRIRFVMTADPIRPAIPDFAVRLAQVLRATPVAEALQ